MDSTDDGEVQMARSKKGFSRGILLSVSAALSSTVAFAGSSSGSLLAIGPVEQVNLKSSTIVVLGQTYNIGPVALSASKSARAVTALASISPNSLVAIYGTESPSGKVNVQNVDVLPQMDVPGATQLLVTGVVSAVSNTGQIRIGKLSIDINAALTSDSKQAALGELVRVVGTQPTAGGVFVAQNFNELSVVQGGRVSAAGIQGTGNNGIQGTGTKSLGIQGTGSNGIQGTGTKSLGIQGTGSNGIQGTGTKSLGIQGTGL
jgi:hypothetical protein